MSEPLFQESMVGDPFAMVVGCVLVNRTRWSAARTVHAELLSRWPTPEDLSTADRGEVRRIVAPLGFGSRRSENLVGLANRWSERGPVCRHDVSALPGCGRYAADAWAIFVEGDLGVEPTDVRLRSHLARVRP